MANPRLNPGKEEWLVEAVQLTWELAKASWLTVQLAKYAFHLSQV